LRRGGYRCGAFPRFHPTRRGSGPGGWECLGLEVLAVTITDKYLQMVDSRLEAGLLMNLARRASLGALPVIEVTTGKRPRASAMAAATQPEENLAVAGENDADPDSSGSRLDTKFVVLPACALRSFAAESMAGDMCPAPRGYGGNPDGAN
jgi:hypothetical protein